MTVVSQMTYSDNFHFSQPNNLSETFLNISIQSLCDQEKKESKRLVRPQQFVKTNEILRLNEVILFDLDRYTN